jgi:hypothetical protein
MSTDCSFFGGSSGNPACANWWITRPYNQETKKEDLQFNTLLKTISKVNTRKSRRQVN